MYNIQVQKTTAKNVAETKPKEIKCAYALFAILYFIRNFIQMFRRMRAKYVLYLISMS